MAKKIINKIKEAEEQAKSAELGAEQKAERIIENAHLRAEEAIKSAIEKAKFDNMKKIQKANEQVNKILSEERDVAKIKAEELINDAQKKQSVVIDEIIGLLF